MDQEPDLVKILYIIPDGEEDAGETEGLYAIPLGNQLYELQNIPISAEHLNVQDIVRCEEPSGTCPVIKELVRPSGNKALRVLFPKNISVDEQVDVIWALLQRGIVYEKFAIGSVAFNITPKDDFISVRDFLRSKESEGVLWLYEPPE